MRNISFIVILTIIYSFIVSEGIMAQNSNNIKKSNEEKVLHTMSYSHLDTEWRWDYRTTIREYILNTMKDNFTLFEKYPHYIFNFSGANRYRMMKEYYPREYERVKKYISENRWFPCGSSMEENDALVPSAESIIRQILYGNNYFKKEFGKPSYDYMLPDCFGFPASLPSILSHCSIKGFSTQKLTWGSAIGIPFNVGLWLGPDESSIVSVFNPGDYITQVKEDLSKSEKWLNRIMELGNKTGLFSEYMYVGTGDLGGAPTNESIRWIEESMKSDGPIKVLSSPADKFFRDISPEQYSKLPTYKGELLLTFHSAGSATSQSYMKRWNRKNELLAYSSEASSVISDWLGGIDYPKERLNEAWRLVLGAQFHDILPGTCIPKAYQYAQNDEILALNQFSGVLKSSLSTIAAGMNTESKGIPVIVYNPLSIEREDVVEATIFFGNPMVKCIAVFDANNNEVPSQIINSDKNKITLIFLAKVSSVSFSTFDIRPSDSSSNLNTGLKITNSSIENERYLVKINLDGDVSSIFDKLNKKEILSEPSRLAFLYEKPREYPAWNMDWEDRKNPPVGFVEGKPKIKIIESGPVRLKLEIERESRGSTFVQNLQLSAKGSGNRVEFKNKVVWFTKESSLKATFPLTVTNQNATYNMGLGTIQRSSNDPKKYEVPSHQWFDLTDQNKNYGVSILEDCKFGSDKPNDNTLRLTLLYTPGTRSDFKDQASQDFGIHEMTYAIYGHKGNWADANSEWEAARLNQPLLAFQTKSHIGELGKVFSFLKISNNNIALKAIKKAENSNEIIIRLQEMKGMDAENIEIIFPTPVISANIVDGQEQIISDHKLKDGKFLFNIKKYQPLTFSIRIDEPVKKMNPPHCESVLLPFNKISITSDENKSDGNLDASGRSIPSELLPDNLKCDGITLSFGPRAKGEFNSVECRGQKIKIPEGKFNSIFLLASSNKGDADGVFKFDNKEFSLCIQYGFGFIGQWDTRKWDGYVDSPNPDYYWGNVDFVGIKPGFIKRDDVGLFTTHLHLKNGENEPYSYGYLYKYRIDIPEGTKEITLPDNENINIFSMTCANTENSTTPAQYLYDNFDRKETEYQRFIVNSKPEIFPKSYIIEEDKPTTISMTAKDSESEIRFTTDGSEPTETSKLYIEPFNINNSTTFKASTFKNGIKPSKTVEAYYYKAYVIQKVEYLSMFSPKYPGNNEETLHDTLRGSTSYMDKAWQGFEENDLDIIIELDKIRPIHKVTVGCLNAHPSWIFLPVGVEISVTEDKKDYKIVKTMSYEIPAKDEGIFLKDLQTELDSIKSKYIRVKVINLNKVPDWHPGAGGKAWMFIDEIVVE